jgi:hypothetical protein
LFALQKQRRAIRSSFAAPTNSGTLGRKQRLLAAITHALSCSNFLPISVNLFFFFFAAKRR